MRVLLIVCLLCSPCLAAPGHRAMVRRTGIVPNKVGNYEGVGSSTRSHADAVSRACYAGQKTPVSIQYSTTRNSRGQTVYNAVVRYQ